jgi:hypothetical protein
MDSETRTLNILNSQLKQIHVYSRNYYEHFLRYRRILLVVNTFVNIFNALSITSLVIYFSGTTTVLILCAVASSLSTLLSILIAAWGIETKMNSYQITYLQLKDLTSTYVPAITHRGKDPVLCQQMLETLNYKTTIIMNHSNIILIDTFSAEQRDSQG